MLMKDRRAFKCGAIGVMAAVAVTLAPAAVGAEPSPGDDLHQVGEVLTNAPVSTEVELNKYVESSTPKTIVQNAKTGEIAKLTVGEGGVSTQIAARTPCAASDVCLSPTNTPLSNYGFYGSGTKTGTWTNRAYWTTGSWYGSVKTSIASSYTQYFGPNTTVFFDRSPVTVVGVRIR